MSNIRRTAADITADCAHLAMELTRTQAVRADAAEIEQRMDLIDAGDVHRAAVALVKALDARTQYLDKRLTTEQALLRLETRIQTEDENAPHCPTCRCEAPVCDWCDQPVVVEEMR